MVYIKEVLSNNKKLAFAYLAVGLFNAFMANYKADYFQKVVDGLAGKTLALGGVLFYGAVLLISYGMNYLDEYPAKKLENGIYLDFKLLALKKISRLDYAKYQKLGTGRLVQQIENGAAAGKSVLFDFWFSFLRGLAPTVLFSLYFIWKINRNITYFLLAGYVVVFIVTNLLLNGLYQIKEKILDHEEALNHFLVRGFMEMPIFRLKGQFPAEIRRARHAKETIVSSKVKMNMIHEAFFTIFAFIVAALDIGILLYAHQSQSLSIGEVVALITLIDNAYTPIAIFNVIYVQYKLNKTAWLRFRDILDLEEDPQLTEGAAFQGLSREIRVENLCFSYEGKEVLKGISLTLKKGEKAAFVGESGSGKSTLAKVLAGLLKYQQGGVFLDSSPLEGLSLETLYEKLSFLSQEAPVFDGTLRENLVFGKEVPDARIKEALGQVQLLPLLSSLPEGPETRVGEKGACLSGGERQRLALARLWFEEPEIVILDEATSAMDNLTEAVAMKNAMERLSHATVVAIAHRLQTIKDFDRIFVFRAGKLIACGTFEELLDKSRYFLALYEKEKSPSKKELE